MSYAEVYAGHDEAWTWVEATDGSRRKLAFKAQCGCTHWANDHSPMSGACHLCDCPAFKGE